MPEVDFANLIPTILYFVNRRCSQTWNIINATIDFHDLTYVYSGNATYIVNGVEYHLESGDFIYIPRDNNREAYTCAEAPMQCFAVNFNLYSLDNEPARLPFDIKFKVGAYSELINLYEDLNYSWLKKEPNYQMKSRATFLLILYKLINHINCKKPINSADPRITKVNKYILENYHNKIEIGHLAELSGLNPVYLGALFKKTNYCTIKEYINRIRINNAENLLSTGGYTVGEAAEHCGFNDIFYFSKVYKKSKGFSPSNLLKDKNAFL